MLDGTRCDEDEILLFGPGAPGAQPSPPQIELTNLPPPPRSRSPSRTGAPPAPPLPPPTSPVSPPAAPSVPDATVATRCPKTKEADAQHEGFAFADPAPEPVQKPHVPRPLPQPGHVVKQDAHSRTPCLAVELPDQENAELKDERQEVRALEEVDEDESHAANDENAKNDEEDEELENLEEVMLVADVPD